MRIKQIRLNNLQYNANRDPQAYRRTPGKPFRIQAVLEGSGDARATVEVDGRMRCEANVALPGTFDCEVGFDSPGSRVATLTVEGGGRTYTHALRLDVMPHAWIG